MNTVNQSRPTHSLSGKPSIVFLAVALGLTGLAGCEREGPGEAAGRQLDQTAEQAASSFDDAKASVSERADAAGDYLDDAAITGKIKAGIIDDPLLKVMQIDVTTTNGMVALSGSVDSQQSIDRALALARDIPGVKSVDNGLVIN